MLKKILPLILLVLLIVGGGFLIVRVKQPSDGDCLGQATSNTVLYYGETCPHCHVVLDWLKTNPGVEGKSCLITKEVYRNEANNEELSTRAQKCQFDLSKGIPVPFLYDGGHCIIGDDPIISYLKSTYQ